MNSENKPRRVCVRIDDEIRWITKNGAHIPIDTETGEVAKEHLFNEEKFQKLIGPEYKGVKGQAAIDLLYREKQGHVKGALYRKEIGSIDAIWGDDSIGLCHIVKKRIGNGVDPLKVISRIAEVVERGDIHEEYDKYELWKDGQMCSVSKIRFGREIRLVITAFPSRKKPSRFSK